MKNIYLLQKKILLKEKIDGLKNNWKEVISKVNF